MNINRNITITTIPATGIIRATLVKDIGDKATEVSDAVHGDAVVI